MFTLILIIVGIYFFFTSYIFRFTLVHIPLVFKNTCKDLYHYFKYKQWREMKTYGTMNIYVADETQPFGSGKTLNMVYQAYNIYRQYDDVEVFNLRAGAWVKQYVHIYSNVKLLGIPYVPLTSTYQLIDVATNDIYQDDNIHIFVFLIDELGRIFNNRDWKTNLNKDMLGALLQQRKNHLCILGTVQDFSLFDATMRKCVRMFIAVLRSGDTFYLDNITLLILNVLISMPILLKCVVLLSGLLRIHFIILMIHMRLFQIYRKRLNQVST